MKLFAERCRAAEDWRSYEAWDNNLHHAIARATHNQLFVYFFETLNSVRRSIDWGVPRATRGPGQGYSSFMEHDAIVSAIMEGDGDLAARMMLARLKSVYSRVLPASVRRDGGREGLPAPHEGRPLWKVGTLARTVSQAGPVFELVEPVFSTKCSKTKENDAILPEVLRPSRRVGQIGQIDFAPPHD